MRRLRTSFAHWKRGIRPCRSTNRLRTRGERCSTLWPGRFHRRPEAGYSPCAYAPSDSAAKSDHFALCAGAHAEGNRENHGRQPEPNQQNRAAGIRRAAEMAHISQRRSAITAPDMRRPEQRGGRANAPASRRTPAKRGGFALKSTSRQSLSAPPCSHRAQRMRLTFGSAGACRPRFPARIANKAHPVSGKNGKRIRMQAAATAEKRQCIRPRPARKKRCP